MVTVKEIKNNIKENVIPFLFYLFTEPFIQLYEILKDKVLAAKVLLEPKTWMYITMILTVIFVFLSDKLRTIIFLIMFLVLAAKVEMDSGFWKERQRERWREKHKKEMEEIKERWQREKEGKKE